MKQKVRNNVDYRHAYSKQKNLLTAITKAFKELEDTTDWVAKLPSQVEYACCSTCIFGSKEFHEGEELLPNRITFNVQDVASYKSAYKENKDREQRHGYNSHKDEILYLQHAGQSHNKYNEVFKVLNKHGIHVHWNWNQDQKIIVYLDKYRFLV